MRIPTAAVLLAFALLVAACDGVEEGPDPPAVDFTRAALDLVLIDAVPAVGPDGQPWPAPPDLAARFIDAEGQTLAVSTVALDVTDAVVPVAVGLSPTLVVDDFTRPFAVAFFVADGFPYEPLGAPVAFTLAEAADAPFATHIPLSVPTAGGTLRARLPVTWRR